ncbi:IclR family transcriptional regulator [Tersicoccus phoenicis]|uniref:IclR family transcriptional regulator n=1 Tax=Tersicoccus phoenicis TaxID=554083 RepID=UPI000A0555C4|nr:helix-turn-helix domain-containing protein [Tersicoccus phoenicis]
MSPAGHGDEAATEADGPVTTTRSSTRAGSSHAQTLSRGVRMLEVLADAEAPLSIGEIAAALGVHRSIAYRILRTLEEHALVVRDDAGKVLSGPGLAVLARSVARSLQSAALPVLTELSGDLGLTAFIAVWDQVDCVTLVTVEPNTHGATLAQRPGTRQSFAAGAPSIAIQSAISEEQWRTIDPSSPYRPEARLARERGYAVSFDEVIPGVGSVAAPILRPGLTPAAVAVVHLGRRDDTAAIGARLTRAAAHIQRHLT